MISFITSLRWKEKENSDWIRFLHCVFNQDKPIRRTDDGRVVITVKEEQKDNFFKWCYEAKVTLEEIEGPHVANRN